MKQRRIAARDGDGDPGRSQRKDKEALVVRLYEAETQRALSLASAVACALLAMAAITER